MITRANDGPRLAPATADTVEMTTHCGAVVWSSSPASMIPTPPGTWSGTFHRWRRAATASPPAAINGIHHHSPDHQVLSGVAEEPVDDHSGAAEVQEPVDATGDAEDDRDSDEASIPGQVERQHGATLPVASRLAWMALGLVIFLSG